MSYVVKRNNMLMVRLRCAKGINTCQSIYLSYIRVDYYHQSSYPTKIVLIQQESIFLFFLHYNNNN